MVYCMLFLLVFPLDSCQLLYLCVAMEAQGWSVWACETLVHSHCCGAVLIEYIHDFAPGLFHWQFTPALDLKLSVP